MSNLVAKMLDNAAWLLFTRNEKIVLLEQLVLVAVAVAAVFMVGWAPAIAVPVGLFLLLGPSRVMVSLFLVYLIASHQFLSIATVTFGGVEWHPREFFLLALLAHCAVKVFQGKAGLRLDAVHFAVVVYGLFFIQIGLVGLVLQSDLHAVIAECRYPVYLAAYLALAMLVRTRADVMFYVKLITALAAGIAVVGLAFFGYAMVLAGPVQLNQTVLGEFMRTPVGPLIVQTVRPNGHMYFEIAIVVLASMILCPATTPSRRLGYLLLMGLLSLAVLITTMRTAYVAVFISLAILVFLMLPGKGLQLAILAGAALLGFVILETSGVLAHGIDSGITSGLDLSLMGRWVEMSGAWHAFTEHPILGAGMGSTFEGLGLVMSGDQLAAGQTASQTVHNVWMYYLFKGGLVGLFLAMAGLGGILIRGYSLIATARDSREQFFLRGLVAAMAGQLIASLAMPRLTYPSGHLLVAMMATAFLVYATERPTSARG